MSESLDRTPTPAYTSRMRLAATPEGRRQWILAGALVCLTLAAYAPTYDADFVWDDDTFILVDTELSSLEGLGKIWFDFGATPQYYPAVFTSFWLEQHVWGSWPGGYHVVNVLLHVANALLLGLLLRTLSVPGAWLAASIFALHPVHVESVAWVSERKNVLSAFFYFTSILTYLRFRDSSNSAPAKALYGVSLALFVVAVLSKTVVASLPAAILLIAWMKEGRLTRGDVIPVLPFFAFGTALGLGTVLLEKEEVGAFGPEWQLSVVEHILLAGRDVWFYAGKLVWPTNLSFIYPRWEIDGSDVSLYFYPATAGLVVLGLWAMRRTIGRGPLTAVLFFGGTLVPALGFFDVYPFIFSYVADHFQYLASAGLIALMAASATSLGQRVARHPATNLASACAAVLLLVLLASMTRSQAATYHSPRTLWETTIERNPDAWMAHHNLGVVDFAEGHDEQGLARYNRAIELNPRYADAFNNRGSVYLAQGEVNRAIADFTQAIESQSDHLLAATNRAGAYYQIGRADLALADFARVVELHPDYARAHHNLAIAYFQGQQFAEAIASYDRAISIDPENGDLYWQRCDCLRQLGHYDEALLDCNRGVELGAGDGRPLIKRAFVLFALGRVAEANHDIAAATRNGAIVPEPLRQLQSRSSDPQSLDD